MATGVETAEGARRGKNARARNQTRTPGEKKNRHLTLTDESWERLTVHALRQGLDKSALVERLISENLKQFVVQDRGGRGPANLAGEASRPVEALPVGEEIHPFPVDASGVTAGEGEGTTGPAPDAPATPLRPRRQPAGR